MKNFIILLFFVVIASLAFADNYTYIKGSQLVESNQALVSDTTETQLSATSPMITVVTGTNTHSIKLPNTASINVGFSYKVINKSTGIVTVKDFSDVVLSTISTDLENTFILFSDGWKVSSGGGSGGGKEIAVTSPLQITQDTDSATISLGTIDYLDFNTATTPVAFDGRVHFDQNDKTLSIDVDSANGVQLQVGQEEYIRAVNKTGLQINDGQVVYINGAQGNRPTIQLAKADALDQSMIIGVATQNIAINAEGMITTYGVVGNYNTSGFAAGDKLYLSASASGTLTNVAPSSPNKVVRVAVALNATNNGKILVNPKVTLDADSSLALNSDLIAPTQKAIKSYVDAGLALKADDISAQMKDFTGFVDPSAVTVSYDSTTRQVSIGGTTTAYWRGKPVTLDSTFPAHANSNGVWFLSYDGGTGTVTWSNTPWTFDKLQIAVVNYQAAYKFATRESHGLMQWNSHKELHETIGTYLSSGGDLSSYVLSSTTVANRRPDISAATINDEDVPTVNASLTSKLYTQFSLSTASSTAGFVTGASDIVPLSGNQPYYNQFTGGAWQQTLMSNNNYQALWLVAIPASSDAGSQAYRFIWVQGQSQSPTLSTIQGLTPNDISLGTLASQAPEYVFIGKIIIQYTAANWVITSVQKLTGNRFNQTGAPAGTYLSSVTTDTTLTGAGTAIDPLKVALPLTATQSALLANTNMTSGYMPKYDGSGLVDSQAYDSGTGIGLGTTTPTGKFHIVSPDTSGFRVESTAAMSTGGGAGIQAFSATPTSANQRLAFYTMGAKSGSGGFAGAAAIAGFSEEAWTFGSAQGAHLRFETTPIGSSTRAEKMRISGDGKIGIGTTTPIGPLHVKSATTTDSSTGITLETPSGSNTARHWIDASNNYIIQRGNNTNHLVLDSSGNVGVGTNSIGSKFEVMESNSTTGAANGITIEQGSTGDASLHWLLSGGQRYTMGIDNSDSDKLKIGTSADLASGNAMVIDSTGNIGMGTTSPTTKLEVANTATGTAGTLSLTNNNPSGTADGVSSAFRLANSAGSLIQAGLLTASKEQAWISGDTSTVNSAFRFFTTANASLTERMRLTSAGRLGINTSTPNARLTVLDSTGATETVAISINGNNSASSNLPAYGFGMGPTSTEGFLTYRAGTGNAANFGHKFFINDTERMRINGLGYMGLGTSSPASVFHMYENNSTTGAANGQTVEQAGTGDAVQHWLLSGGQRYTMGIDNSDSDKFKLGTNADLASNNLLTVTTTGNLGVGTTSPTGKIHVTDSVFTNTALIERTTTSAGAFLGAMRVKSTTSADMTDGFGANIVFNIQDSAAVENIVGAIGAVRSGADNTGSVVINTSNAGAQTEKMRITNDGKVGIGTNAPEVALHVSGDTVATGYQYFGSSTADGSFRMYVSGGALITEKRISGVWTELSRVDEL